MADRIIKVKNDSIYADEMNPDKRLVEEIEW